MSQLAELIQLYGALIVFGIVLVEQAGLPIPAFPALVVAGAMTVERDASAWLLWLAAIGACLICDLLWFHAGRRYGKHILRLLCKVSLSPDSCVGQTEDRFRRFGVRSLLVSKFVPGFNTVAAPLSGALGVAHHSFVGHAMLGAAFWSGTGILLGAWCHDSVGQLLDWLSALGSAALTLLGCLLALFIGAKFVQRRRQRAGDLAPRLDPAQLDSLTRQGKELLVLDVRSQTAQQLRAPIPGAMSPHMPDHAARMASLAPAHLIVVYCGCGMDVSAAKLARQLSAQGFEQVHVLRGGIDGWHAWQQSQGALTALKSA